MRFLVLLLLSFSAHAHDLACTGSGDSTPAFNTAVAAATASTTDKTVNISAGLCSFYTKPSPVTYGVRLIGQGKSQTVLRRMYTGDTLLTVGGLGVYIKDMTLQADSTTAGGIGIYVISDNTAAGGNHVIEGVWITTNGTGTWNYALYLGGFRTSAPAGLRTVTLRDVSLFNATVQAAVIWGCIACEWYGGGAYQGGGSTQLISVGGGTVNLRIDALVDIAGSTAAGWIAGGSMR